MKSRIISYFVLLIGVLSLSTSAIFVKLADAPASITAFYRLFFVVIILLPLVFFNNKNRAELQSLSRKQLGLGICSGIFLSIHYVLWFESLNYTSVASSTVLVTLQPLFAIIGCYFLFNERYSKGALLGCLVAILGCFIIGWGDFQINSRALFGDILALTAAGVMTIYFMIGQHMRKKLSVIPYSFIGYTSSAFLLFVYAYSQRLSFFTYPVHSWISFIGLAVIATILGQMSFNWLLKWFSTSVISMCILGEVVGTCLLAYFILNEILTLQQSIGIFVILSGLMFFLIEENKKSKVADTSANTPSLHSL